MATFYKRKGKRGIRWTVRVRIAGRESTKTFATKASAESWARSQEIAIETGEFIAPASVGSGPLFADLVDDFLAHRKKTRRTPGSTFANALHRLKDEHGLEPVGALTRSFWRDHVLRRIDKGAASQTATSDLAYASAVIKHAHRQGVRVDAQAPGEARAQIKDEGLRVVSRHRERRISDKELDALLEACDKVDSHIPLTAIVKLALCTALRRGEILRIRWDDVDEVARTVAVRNRKHPTDRERVDKVPLMRPRRGGWPHWDALELIRRQQRTSDRIFPFVADTVAERFERACEAAKVSGLVFHGLRHEAISRYAGRGLDVMRLQLISGHRDVRHLSRYVTLDPSALAHE